METWNIQPPSAVILIQRNTSILFSTQRHVCDYMGTLSSPLQYSNNQTDERMYGTLAFGDVEGDVAVRNLAPNIFEAESVNLNQQCKNRVTDSQIHFVNAIDGYSTGGLRLNYDSEDVEFPHWDCRISLSVRWGGS